MTKGQLPQNWKCTVAQNKTEAIKPISLTRDRDINSDINWTGGGADRSGADKLCSCVGRCCKANRQLSTQSASNYRRRDITITTPMTIAITLIALMNTLIGHTLSHSHTLSHTHCHTHFVTVNVKHTLSNTHRHCQTHIITHTVSNKHTCTHTRL